MALSTSHNNETKQFRGDTEAAFNAIYLSSVWIPAEDSVVFSTAQQELRISLAPGYGQNSPERKYQQKAHTVYSAR